MVAWGNRRSEFFPNIGRLNYVIGRFSQKSIDAEARGKYSGSAFCGLFFMKGGSEQSLRCARPAGDGNEAEKTGDRVVRNGREMGITGIAGRWESTDNLRKWR